jgi:hypothetical protein
LNARYRRAIRARGHFPNEQAALKCWYLVTDHRTPPARAGHDGQRGGSQRSVAQLRYTKATRLWTLYWRDRNLKFHKTDRVPASASVEELLVEVDGDPTAIVWG